MKKMTLAEFRLLVRKIVTEYVANDEPTDKEPRNARKADHADPSMAHMDSGLDEADKDHEDKKHGTEDPRWEDHPDPTGKEWSSGLDAKD